jgi:hypothetical protein
MTHWVVDASPLIFLAKLERLALLHQSSSEVYVPPQVLTEIRAQRYPSVGAIEQAVRNWLRVKAPRGGTESAIVVRTDDGGLTVERFDPATKQWERRLGILSAILGGNPAADELTEEEFDGKPKHPALLPSDN